MRADGPPLTVAVASTTLDPLVDPSGEAPFSSLGPTQATSRLPSPILISWPATR
jgi:hypothetical protein